jgi:hypothetical protein
MQTILSRSIETQDRVEDDEEAYLQKMCRLQCELQEGVERVR